MANQQYNNIDLYVTADEEEILLTNVADRRNKEDDDGLIAAAHYITVHYAEKQGILTKKKKYKPKSRQFQLNAGIREFGSKGESAVTKELEQFNKYNDVFEPKCTADLSDEEKRNALASLIFLK